MTANAINKKLINDIIKNGTMHNSYICTECDNTSVVNKDNKIQCEYCGNILLGDVEGYRAKVFPDEGNKKEKLAEEIEDDEEKEKEESEKVTAGEVVKEEIKKKDPRHSEQRIFNARQKFQNKVKKETSRSMRQFLPFLILFTLLFLSFAGIIIQHSAGK